MDILALLFPREKKFYKMLEEQVELVSAAVTDFHRLVIQFDKLSAKARIKLIAEIGNKERKDDVLYTRMVRELKSTFITPMDREDLHQIAAIFDSIIDTLELLTLKVGAFEIKKIDKNLKAQIMVLYESFKLVEKLILSIRSEKEVEKLCYQVRQLEQEADRLFIKSLKDIFSDSARTLTILKLKDLYASVEDMIDKVNEAAVIIENVVVKYS